MNEKIFVIHARVYKQALNAGKREKKKEFPNFRTEFPVCGVYPSAEHRVRASVL